MPRRKNGEIPLPHGWDFAQDYDGKIYFIDHNSKKTTWIDPRDRFTKPQTFADCIGNELPLGWEEAYDPQIGSYFINHVDQSTQLEDPRLEWRAIQEAMLRDYLQTAQTVLEAKKEIYDIKQQRLCLAQDEYNHLHNALSTLNTSRTSLCSSSSSVSTKYDPDLLKSDVALARNRVARLRRELEQIQVEMNCTQRGVNTLALVEQKLSEHNGGCYNITEAQAIMAELRSIQKSLSSGEKEKAELMQSLAKLKDDFTRLQLYESSPDASTLSLPQEKLSTASQTDLSGELVPVGTRLAEMARMRLQYDEARKQVQDIQHQLADLEEKVTPGQAESDKDRLLLFQEKEQLLRELRSITPCTRSQQEMEGIQSDIKRLEEDLNTALEVSNRAITDRLRLHEEKQLLLQQLRDALRSMTQLESQLKTLSASTLSVSSSSSLGSLSTASSKGSLSSALSFTDIYGSSQCTQVDMVDLHRRVERLLKCGDSLLGSNVFNSSPGLSQPSLSPRSSLSSVSPPVSPAHDSAIAPPPAYEQVEQQKLQQLQQSWQCIDGAQLEDRLSELRLNQNQDSSCSGGSTAAGSVSLYTPRVQRTIPPNITLAELLELTRGCNMSQGSGLGRPEPLSPISETPAITDDPSELLQGVTLFTPTSSGSNTRSVSAAVSDESVAGDSGVFEASNKKCYQSCGGRRSALEDMNLETAQVQIKLRYSTSDGLLHVGIERARNLTALFIPENCQVCIKAALLPSHTSSMSACCTKPITDLCKPTFGEDFSLLVPLSKLYTKTLQVNVWCIELEPPFHEDCVGCAQVSLADFSTDTVSLKWYNILSFRFMQSPHCLHVTPDHEKQEIDMSAVSKQVLSIKEESSDESTVTSSQTSTLTRNQGLQPTISTVRLEELDSQEEAELDEEEHEVDNVEDDGEEEEEVEEDDEDEVEQEQRIFHLVHDDIIEDEQENTEVAVETRDSETNTECVFIPEKGMRRKNSEPRGPIVIKRSQTFSPSAVMSRNEYICRLNRSDSDSSMPLYRKGGPFQRNSVERRSLRWRKPPGTVMKHRRSSSTGHVVSPHITTTRTSLDLELDLQAQHTRLVTLRDELSRLRELKLRLESARLPGDQELVSWLLEDEQFQNMIAQAENDRNGKNVDEQKIEKLLKKTSKEIYKLRKSKAGKGKPDVITFREKMAFFTRVNITVPVLPPEAAEVNTRRNVEDAVEDRGLGVEV